MATRWSLDWHARPSEEAALLNPAFCGELIARAVHEYGRIRAAAFPLPLSFIVLPLVLHPPTRAALPGRANTTFATWSAEHEALLAELPGRTISLRPVTREALLFLIQHTALSVVRDGLSPGSRPLKLTSKIAITTDDVDLSRRAAGLLGRWFANQGAPVQILQTMGVAP